MSVLIKGLKMPKSCGECIFEIFGWCYINLNTEPKNKLTHSCPLIELPDHGDLIDRDALEEQGWTMNRTVAVNPQTVEMQVKKPTDFPAIIDAVPVVRCKDCKWWREETDHTCRMWGGASPRKANGYCDDGERSEE